MRSECLGAGKALPRWLLGCPAKNALAALVAIGLAIRVYLSATSYCISGDGGAYIGMARDFAAGDPRKALTNVFSPLYPAIVALVHAVLPNWEAAGNLVSVVLGSAAIVTVFGMTRALFDRRDLALGAAALMAIHPDMAAYSASVRTEAGFVLLAASVVWLLVASLKGQRLLMAAAAGVTGGVAYLYRTEAIGLLVFFTAFIPLGAVLWRRWRFAWALAASAVFALGFLAIAAPYLLFLHSITGRWSVGREFTAAMILSMTDATANPARWRQLAFSPMVSPFVLVFTQPRLYLDKVARDFAASCYSFVQTLGIALTIALLIGLWRRGLRLTSNFAEAMAGLLILFYLTGFALSQTGTRFMSHLIPYTFGWVMIGLESLSATLGRVAMHLRLRPLPQGALALAVGAALLPVTLWPIGYDQRGLRYAGELIRHDSGPAPVVAARDSRVAYYADAAFLILPDGPMPDLCAWLHARNARYLLLTNHDESALSPSLSRNCLTLMRRYSHGHSSYYDLFAINRLD